MFIRNVSVIEISSPTLFSENTKVVSSTITQESIPQDCCPTLPSGFTSGKLGKGNRIKATIPESDNGQDSSVKKTGKI